jgi:NADP-dependent 3-hydroxy acid dehydrogenase YdfG
MVKLKPLFDQVVVITGASSGIGLATAKLAAQRGAKVVLAARSRDALARAVDEINQTAGPGSAAFVEADVGRHEENEKIAAFAIQRFGRIDTWVNNAGVLVFGRLEELAEADMRQLFETNFWGVVHGSLVAVRHLKASGGALINVGSLESDRGLPLQGIYAASKHAVKGFTDVLRMELQAEAAPISVTLVKPGTIATPLPEHARTYGDKEPQFPPPHYSPEEVARTILAAAERPVRVAYVGGAARAFGIVAAVAPRAVDWVSQRFLQPGQISDRPVTPTDNLHAGQAEGRAHGDRTNGAGRPSLYSVAARNPVATVAVAGGIAAGAFLLTRRRHEAAHLFAGTAGEEDLAASPPLEGV